VIPAAAAATIFAAGAVDQTGRETARAPWSGTEEMIELAKAVKQFDGLYTTHMRNEGDRLLEAVEESLRIGVESDVHVHISHHKSAGWPNWGKVKESLARVDTALAGGQRVRLDVYPYTAGSGRERSSPRRSATGRSAFTSSSTKPISKRTCGTPT
jgi:N-acyl-D-aspartate/D-glutamate deacylase